tara:strand:+ start:576 stop:1559 length:984 start_codon:yes stop_codon:yes gene_type:complete
MANYNKNIGLVVGGSVNAYFYRQNVISGDTLTVRVNNNHSGYNGWYGYVQTGSVTPSSHSNTSGSSYGLSPATGIVFTVTGGTYYNLVLTSYYSGSSAGQKYKTHHIFGTVTAGTTTYSLSAPSTIQEGTTGTVNISATNHTASLVYWSATPAADFSPDTGTDYVNSSGTGSFSLSPVSDNSTEGNETATIRLYSNSLRTIQIASTTTTITDQATGGSGGGSTGGGTTGGNTAQGIEVFSQSGTKIFGTDLRTQNLQYELSLTLAGGATSGTYAMADANDSTKCLITTLGYLTVSNSAQINTSSTGFSVTNTRSYQITFDILAFRIG